MKNTLFLFTRFSIFDMKKQKKRNVPRKVTSHEMNREINQMIQTLVFL